MMGMSWRQPRDFVVPSYGVVPSELDAAPIGWRIRLCAGLPTSDIVTTHHQPVHATVGNTYVVAEVTSDALAHAAPEVAAFRRVLAETPRLNGRFSLYLYARDGVDLRARMFAPLAGTYEDAATGSAATPLAALLLSLTNEDEARYTIRQGVESRANSPCRAAQARITCCTTDQASHWSGCTPCAHPTSASLVPASTGVTRCSAKDGNRVHAPIFRLALST
jgi:hypothetical protein